MLATWNVQWAQERSSTPTLATLRMHRLRVISICISVTITHLDSWDHVTHTHIRFMALWTLSWITRVSRYQNQSGFYWSKRQWVAVASAGPYAICTSPQTDNHTSTPPLKEIEGKVRNIWRSCARVTWRHRSCDHWNCRWSFPIGGLLTPSHYLARLPRYWASDISGSWPCPFRVTWRHRSRDHSNHSWSFPIGHLLTPCPYLAPLLRY